jgi:hypothetical protein
MNCPHCGASQTAESAFCTSCGKALPSGTPTGPRIVDNIADLQTDAGRTLQGAELEKELKKATRALLAVAIMQVLFGGLLLVLSMATNAGDAVDLPGQSLPKSLSAAVFVSVFTIGAIFFGLYFWARKSPFPAAIVGLVLFLTVHALDALASPAALGRGIIIKASRMSRLSVATSRRDDAAGRPSPARARARPRRGRAVGACARSPARGARLWCARGREHR